MLMLFMAVSLGEMVISGLWLPAYYRYSIPLFRKEYPLTTMPDLAGKIPELEQKLKRSMWRPAIVFRALDSGDIAFRNKFGTRNAMSGLVRLEPNQGRMRISGNLYWTFLLMPFLFLFMMVSSPSPSIMFLVILLLMFVLTFAMQRYQYGKIAAVVAETAVSAPSFSPNPVDELTQYAPKPERILSEPQKTVSYNPELDAYKPPTPQTGLSNTEMGLIIVLMALVAMGCVAGILLFGS